jgi:integrase
MPVYQDKKTKRFFIQFSFNRQTFKQRMPKGATRKDADRLETKLKNQLFFESHGGRDPKDISFQSFLIEYYLPWAENHHSTQCFDKDVQVCNSALPFLKDRPMRSIRLVDIERFKAARTKTPTMHGKPRKPATVARELSVISKVFSLAVKNGVIENSPCTHVEKPVFDNVQDKILPPEHEDVFINAMQNQTAKDVCVMVLQTGLRQNDVLGLTRMHCNFQTNRIRLIQGKTQRRIEIPMNDVVREIIERRRHNGNPDQLLFPNEMTGKKMRSIRTAITNSCRRAGIERITIRDLRRTVATALGGSGFDAVTVSRYLGHSDLRSVHRYQRNWPTMEKAAESLANRAKILPLVRSEKAK